MSALLRFMCSQISLSLPGMVPDKSSPSRFRAELAALATELEPCSSLTESAANTELAVKQTKTVKMLKRDLGIGEDFYSFRDVR